MEGKRKTLIGSVISDRMDKTVVVVVESRRRHPLYGKIVSHATKFKAHDAGNTCQVGDKVRIVETRPLSKEKRWRVVEIVAKGGVAKTLPEKIGLESVLESQQDDTAR